MTDFSIGVIKTTANPSVTDGPVTSPDTPGDPELPEPQGERNNYKVFAIINLIATIIIFSVLQAIICIKK